MKVIKTIKWKVSKFLMTGWKNANSSSGLLITGILSLDCNFLHVHLRRLTWQNLRVLNTMSNSFPLECLGEIKGFELPHELLSQPQSTKRDITEAIYEMVIQAFSIFYQYTSKSSLEERHLNQIQVGLDRKLQYLENCMEEEKEKETLEEKEDTIIQLGAMVLHPSNLEVKRYFKMINNFLKDKKYSHCAWEIVLVEMRRYFYYLQKFTTYLKKK
ncbi:interferon kappa [Sorex araneus]|uniref:interferon kappa n=1 Tax=Sorex araneus TaxID=42254 RepID=UPI00243353AE|nr:interferon kappa [Sorex araneus]